MPASFKSFCGSCSQEVDRESYEELVWGGTVTLACGHENTLASLFVPLNAEGKAMRSNQETKRATWFVLSPDPELDKTFGENCEDPAGLMPMRSLAGAWDAYWAGAVKPGEDGTFFLYELKAYRFMDYNPRVMQGPDSPFDTHEFEGSRFISRDYDPTSMGVVVKKSFVRLVKKTPVSPADAPEGSVYGARITEK